MEWGDEGGGRGLRGGGEKRGKEGKNRKNGRFLQKKEKISKKLSK